MERLEGLEDRKTLGKEGSEKQEFVGCSSKFRSCVPAPEPFLVAYSKARFDVQTKLLTANLFFLLSI